MKLGNLLKKELRELLTVQAVFAMLFTCILLIVLGQVMGTAMENAMFNTTINIANYDNSEFTEKMLSELSDYGSDVNAVTFESTIDLSAELERLGLSNAVIIPDGFGDSVINSDEPASLNYVSLINSTGLASSMTDITAASVTSSISNYVSDYIKNNRLNLTENEQALIETPVLNVEFTAANGKTVQVSSSALSSMLMMQSFIAPFAVFFLVLMASQMIMTAISTEKIDKTLETLMSAPVSRITVLTAKMLAALIVALLNAASMIVGFVFYIKGMVGTVVNMETAEAELAMDGSSLTVAGAMAELGLTLNLTDIIFFGLQLFLTIAIGLSLSLILGAMATDVKSVQTLVMPIMIATMIPFMVTMFADVNSLPTAAKIIMYIIPFTHTYTAMSNLMFGNDLLFWIGFAYQLVFFAICMYLAVKVFTTDLLFTMSFNPESLKGKRKPLLGGKAK